MEQRRITIERCLGTEPIIAPTSHWWETGVTFNAAAVYLDRTAANDPIIQALLPMRRLTDPELADGVVAIHYRARPETDPGLPFVRSFIGLALFSPTLKLLYRYREPVLYPEPMPQCYDYLGVEDPRITRLGDTFYMLYCGLKADPETIHHPHLCLASSTDLLHWRKLGAAAGDINKPHNKDGVLFPETFRGKYYMLHRPWWKGLAHGDYAMCLAASESPEGPWRDLGEILHSFRNPKFTQSWVGAGSVPIALGGDRYLVIYHTGNSDAQGKFEYQLDVAMVDFKLLSAGVSRIVTSRIEHLMVPETPHELSSSSSLRVQNVVFTCGSYEYRGDIYIVYGGADTCTMVARVRKELLVQELEKADLKNPFVAGG